MKRGNIDNAGAGKCRIVAVEEFNDMFDLYVGIDYSGAATPLTPLSGLRVYAAAGAEPAVEQHPPGTRRRRWTRQGIARWLYKRLQADIRLIAGIDHGFSFPRSYFERHALAPGWPGFLDDFVRHWPTDRDDVTVEDVRRGRAGRGAARDGDSRWRRLTELRAGGAKSVFHFDVPGSVAKSTHAGLPWLRYLRRHTRAHFWPYDGWIIPDGRSVVVEAYPSLWRHTFGRGGRTADQHDAFTVAAWLQQSDRDGRLAANFSPALSPAERTTAAIEGWIIGVG